MTNLAIKLPLRYSEENGYYESITDVSEQIKQNLRDLFLTARGERYFEVDYGVGLYEYLFEPLTEGTKLDLQDDALGQIGTYLPYLEVLIFQVTEVTGKGGATGLRVYLEYRVTPFGNEAIDSLDIEALV